MVGQTNILHRVHNPGSKLSRNQQFCLDDGRQLCFVAEFPTEAFPQSAQNTL